MIKKNNNGFERQLQFIIYSTSEADVSVRALIKDETLWLTQRGMSELFGAERSVITKHLLNIYTECELEKESTCANFAQVQNEGERSVTRNVEIYNLDAIIAVGYRVNSKKATRFRQWATKVLREYIQKGFVLDDDRLKQGQTAFGKDYFRELLERVRSIRASERRIWQQITDIFAECSIDYEKDSQTTQKFYATIQNKFHYAITGQTAAEIVYDRADANKENMGLTTWRNSPDGRILKSDVIIGKNYLPEKDIKRLERAVSGYFDYVEDIIEGENVFTMEEFSNSVNEFLAFRKFKILPNNGRIARDEADRKALNEYEIFNKTQKIVSDFDKSIKALTARANPNDTEDKPE